jgi:hypothetical protein
VSTLSSYADKYTQHEGWGNNVVIRKTGEKVWEPMPLVCNPFPPNPNSVTCGVLCFQMVSFPTVAFEDFSCRALFEPTIHGSTHELECIYFLWESYRMKVSKCIHGRLTVALEDGYLEKLFIKESIEQGKHFDSPASVSKIVCPPKINSRYSLSIIISLPGSHRNRATSSLSHSPHSLVNPR